MWYVFNILFQLQGILGEATSTSIVHHYFEADEFTMTLPFTDEDYAILQEGYILTRGDQKGYKIHTLDIKEDDHVMDIYALGLESLLNQRVVSVPVSYNTNSESILYSLVNKNIVNPTDANRKMNGVVLDINQNRGNVLQSSYYGENCYSIVSEIAKSEQMGYTISFDAKNQKMTFLVYMGTDRTTQQNVNHPIGWSSKRQDTRNETITTSVKDYKNVVYLQSGDTSPIKETVGSASGFDRYETYVDANDVSMNLQDDTNTVLTNAQVQQILINRGNVELFKNKKLDDFTFILSTDLPQVFNQDFFVGDKVSLINETYQITKHARITTVKETIIQQQTQYEVTFDEQ